MQLVKIQYIKMLDIRVIYKNNQVFTSWQQIKNKKIYKQYYQQQQQKHQILKNKFNERCAKTIN